MNTDSNGGVAGHVALYVVVVRPASNARHSMDMIGTKSLADGWWGKVKGYMAFYGHDGWRR